MNMVKSEKKWINQGKKTQRYKAMRRKEVRRIRKEREWFYWKTEGE